ncbi:MAG: hypothetical protein ACLFUJ_02865 [Phycisphaerae bacterium]
MMESKDRNSLCSQANCENPRVLQPAQKESFSLSPCLVRCVRGMEENVILPSRRWLESSLAETQTA